MKNEQLKKLVLTAMFFAIGLVLPSLTGQVPQIGRMLLPMHIPVLLCSLIVGWKYASVLGFLLPLVRSLIFITPTLYPNAVGMAFELAAYGLFAGLIYSLLLKTKLNRVVSLYASLISAMLLGRLVWGAVRFLLLGIAKTDFSFSAFLAGAVLNAVPGIILQIVLVPIVVLAVEKVAKSTGYKS